MIIGSNATSKSRVQQSGQHGSVLVTTIILVLMLTILGVGAISLNTTQTRIATSSADAQTAFQTAEGALNEAQGTLPGIAGKAFPVGIPGYYDYVATDAPKWTQIDWTTNSAIASFQGQSRNPGLYIIERLGPTQGPGNDIGSNNGNGTAGFGVCSWHYRVTSRAYGASGGPMVELQQTVEVQVLQDLSDPDRPCAKGA